MRNDIEYVPTVPVKVAKKKSEYRAAKVLLTGAMLGTVCVGYWQIALILLPVLLGVNTIGKKVMGL